MLLRRQQHTQFVYALQHFEAVSAELHPFRQAAREAGTEVGLAEACAHKVFEELDVPVVEGPEDFAAARNLKPERGAEIPVAAIAELGYFLALPLLDIAAMLAAKPAWSEHELRVRHNALFVLLGGGGGDRQDASALITAR